MKDMIASQPNTIVKQYIELCVDSGRAKLEKTVEKFEKEVTKAQNDLIAKIRKLEDERRKLASLDDTSVQKLSEDFTQLLKHPDIQSVDIVGKKIKVHTNMISIVHGKRSFRIGKFVIEMRTEFKRTKRDQSGYAVKADSSELVRMTNVTAKVRGCFDHPHVKYGVPCLGNLKAALPHVIAMHQYPAAISLCIQYLKSYNASDSLAASPELWDRPNV
jgi:hypothetical protein